MAARAGAVRIYTVLRPRPGAKTARSRWHWSAPSAVACVRSCADACCSLLVRRRCSVAPASAQRCEVHLSGLQHGLHNLPHSNKHGDVFELMLECSWLVGQLPNGLSAWPVLLTRAGTSSRVAGVAGRVGSVGVSMGRMPGCHGGPSRAGRGGSAFATRARCVDGGTGWSSPSVALLCVTGRQITGHMVLLVFGANSVHQPRTTST